MKFYINLLMAIIALAVVLPLHASANENPVYDMQPVGVIATDDIVENAFAVLVRNEDEAAMMIHTGGLVPGEAVTAWWVIFNNPEACSDGACGSDDLPQNDGSPAVEAAMLFGDGQIVDENGEATFTARRAVNDDSAAYAFETDGLTDMDNAEIHIVLRTHGPALEDANLLDAQLTTLNGGCENGSEASGTPGPNTCTNVQSSIFIVGR